MQLNSDPEEVLTLEQLAKFVALTQMYPLLLFDPDTERQLLNSLQYFATNKLVPDKNEVSETVRHWARQEEVMRLLSFGVDPDSLTTSKYSVVRLNVDKLIQVSPYVPRQASTLKNFEATTTDQAKGSDQQKSASSDASSRFDYRQLNLRSSSSKLPWNNAKEDSLLQRLMGPLRAYIDNGVLVIEFDYEQKHYYDTLAKVENLKTLREVTHEILNRDVQLRLNSSPLGVQLETKL